MNWYALVRPFLDIALIRDGPQCLPTSRLLLTVAYLGYAVVAVVVFGMRYSASTVIAAVVLDLVLVTAFFALVLDFKGQRARIVQSLTAIVGTSALLGFCLLPVQVWLLQADHGEAIHQGHALVWLLLVAWDMLIRANVLRNALELRWGMALAYSFAYFWVSLRMMQGLLGALGAIGSS